MGNTKLAVITGAAQGIGLALAKACIQENMDIVMVDIAASNLEQQVSQLQRQTATEVHGMVCDVARQDEMIVLARQIMADFKRIDLLINNAGISGHIAPLWDISTEHIRHVLDVNLYGVLHGVKAFLPYMFEQSHESHIVNMASLYGVCSGSQLAAYAMSKHAVFALSESLYFDLRRTKKPVQVSVVCPSITNTNFLANSAPSCASEFHTLLGQIMEFGCHADDVAKAVMQGIKNKTFYILPDKEVKHYCEQRAIAIMEQSTPHEHSIERIFNSLYFSVR